MTCLFWTLLASGFAVWLWLEWDAINGTDRKGSSSR